jgi:hypothetical protein
MMAGALACRQMGGGLAGLLQRREARILLFLKKKKQKDFYPFAPRLDGLPGRKGMKSFLVLFFKKEPLAYALSASAVSPSGWSR